MNLHKGPQEVMNSVILLHYLLPGSTLVRPLTVLDSQLLHFTFLSEVCMY